MGREGEAGPEMPALDAEGAAGRLPRPGSDPLVYSTRGSLLEVSQVEPRPPPRMRMKAVFRASKDAVGLRTAQVCVHARSHACLGVHRRQPQAAGLSGGPLTGDGPHVWASLCHREPNKRQSSGGNTAHGLPAGGRYLSSCYSRLGRGSGSVSSGRSGLGAASAGAGRLGLLCKARTDTEPAPHARLRGDGRGVRVQGGPALGAAAAMVGAWARG